MTTLETEITKATIFRDGARVTRTGTVTLDPGPQKVKVSRITSRAQYDSFRVKGKGPASIASIDVQTLDVKYEPKEDIKELVKQLKKLNEERSKVNDEIGLYTARLTNLEGMTSQFAENFGLLFAAGEAQIEQLTEMDSGSSKMIIECKKKLRDLEEKLKELQDQINIIHRNIGEVEAERRTERFFEVEINLDVKQKGPVELNVTYQLDGAWWFPTYDVDLLIESAKLRRIASVNNRTGEDWNNIEMTISTATARPVEAVEPSPFYISVYVPERERAKRMAKKEKARRSPPKPSMVAPGAAAPAPPPEPAPMVETFAEASEGESGISIYELPKAMTIPSDDDEHPVTLTEEELESKTIHYWFTDGMAEVVAQDEVTNGDAVILSGKMKVFAEGDYIGETSISQIAPRETFKVGTRTAYNVKAKKDLVERVVEKAGVTRGKRKRSYRYRLTIENFSKRKIAIKVADRVPKSLNPEIEVKFEWEKHQKEENNLGILTWEFDMEPGEKQKIEYDFEVQWEKGVHISPPLP